MTPKQFAQVIAEIESGGDPEAWGDHGRAMGAYQVRPAWLWEWAHTLGVAPPVGVDWDDWVRTVVEAFAGEMIQRTTPVRLAMYFHLGHPAIEQSDTWDKTYAAKFEAAAQKLVIPL
jgi:hypothetical protein